MHYRAHVDVHTQRPPEALSVSINLVARTRRKRWEQLLFDVEQGRVRAPVEGASRARALLCSAAGHLGDARTASLLERVAHEHPCGTTRIAALDSVANLEPSHGERLWARAVDDANPCVRARARERLRATRSDGPPGG